MTATLQDIPSGERIHIGFFGRRNSGKSALANAFAGQEISIVSDQAGTTTDPVKKPMEICGLGACVLIDTAGFDDRGALGESRVEKTKKVADMTDIALLLCMDTFLGEEKKWYEHFQSKSTPVIPVINKSDLLENIEMVETAVNQYLGERPVIVSARTGDGLSELKERIVGALPEGCDRPDITGQLAGPGDVVLLVMPQDIHAPRGRLILPQVQTIKMYCSKHRDGEADRSAGHPEEASRPDYYRFPGFCGCLGEKTEGECSHLLFRFVCGLQGGHGLLPGRGVANRSTDRPLPGVGCGMLYPCTTGRRHWKRKDSPDAAQEIWRKYAGRYCKWGGFSGRSDGI